jgi:hypothetical protein
MSRIAATLVVLGLYALHQDVWFWNDATPLVFGVLPIGLFYHVAYTLFTAVAMALLVKTCWPSHLDSGKGASVNEPARTAAFAPKALRRASPEPSRRRERDGS